MGQKIILLRHAESVKNIKKIHGGHGEEITQHGYEQAKEVSDFLKGNNLDKNLKILASTSFHTRATAQIIADQLNLTLEKPYEFRPLYLGIADGLSEMELERISPETSENFRKWRRGEIDIKKLIVKDMESYKDFWIRGEHLVEKLSPSEDVLLICSNSLMILLTHLMRKNNPDTTDKYKHFSIQNCGMITFDRNNNKFELNTKFTNVKIDF